MNAGNINETFLLQESEERYKNFIEGTHDLVQSIGINGEILFVNKAWEKALGYSEKDRTALSLFDIIAPGSQKHCRNIFQKILAGETISFMEVAFIKKNGEKIFLEGNAFPRIINGKVIATQSFFRDISDKRKAEEAVNEMNAEYNSIVENIHEALVVDDKDGKLVFVNSEFCRIFGYTRDEFTNLTLKDYTSPESYPEVIERHNKRMKGINVPNEFEYKGIRKDGTEVWMDARVSLVMHNGIIIGTRSLERDISIRKKAEEALKENEQLFNESQRIARIGSWKFNLRDQSITWTSETYRLFGVSADSFTPAFDSYFHIIHPDDRYNMKAWIAKCVEGKNTSEIHHRIVLPDGNVRYVCCQCEMFYDTAGSPLYMSGTVQDVTERKLAEQKLLKSEEQYKDLIENITDLICTHDMEGRIFSMNKATEKHIGLHFNPKMQLYVKDILALGYKDKFDHYISEIKKNGSAKGFMKVQTFTGEIQIWEYNNTLKQTGPNEFIVRGYAKNITENKRSEKKIKESEERYRSVFEKSGEAILLTKPDGTVLSANPEACNIFGRSEEEICNLGRTGLVDLNDPRLAAALESRIKHGEFRGELNFLRRDGTVFPGELTSTVFTTSSGEERTIVLIRDISSRKRAEEILRENEAKFRSVVENIHESLLIDDIEGNLIYANNEFTKMFGFTAEEIKNLTLKDFTAAESYDEVMERHNNRIKGMQVADEFEYKGLRKDGTELWIQARVSAIVEGGRIIGTQSLERDITERKLAEEKIKESELRYRSIIEQASDSIVIADLQGNFIDINPSFQKLLGFSREELLKRNIKTLMEPEQIKTDPLRFDLLIQGHTILRERKLVHKDGSIVDVEVNVKRISDGRILSIFRDVTERKKTEQEILQMNEQLRNLSVHLQTIREEERTFIAREIHDELGQQLSGLMMDLSNLIRKSENEELKQSVAGMMKLVDQTIKTVRRISSDLRPPILDDLGLVSALEWFGSEFEARTGVSCLFDTKLEEQLFEKNFTNAIFRIFQETLTNVTRHSSASKINVSLQNEKNNIILSVRDNGSGFDELEIKEKKTLGLLGMKERAKMINGDIAINSKPGMGTTVTITAPIPF